MEQTIEMAREAEDVFDVQLHASWLSSASAFSDLAVEWQTLLGSAGLNNAFVTHEWMSAWWETWGAGRSLAIITVRESSGRLLGIAPFSIEKVWLGCIPIRRLRFIADAYSGSDYLSIISALGNEARVNGEIVRTLDLHRSEWDSMALHDTADSAQMADFCFQLKALGMRGQPETAAVCYYVPLPQTPEHFLKGLGSHLRCNYKRRWRIVEREGSVQFLSIKDLPTLVRYFPDLIRLHRMRFQQRQEVSAFTQPKVLAFHAKVMERLAKRGLARLLLIRVNGDSVASLYGFESANTFQFYQCGMHPDWKQKGVGQMMTGRAMEEAIRLGCTEFDFLRGGESYKAHWAERSRSTVTVRLFDSRWRSRYAEAVWLASVAARRWKHRLVALWKKSSEDTGDE